ncbi:MAG: class I SAM-dependent methyltransferase [Candidatus Thorarchaeota archaeon]|nr:MAG: class I SAM-dependent methyltransferase [Candidatus Thorarchaeota archaeon]
MEAYYSERLSAERLKRCYEVAPPRIMQYLEAEVQHVLARLNTEDVVLELGCGFARFLSRLDGYATRLVGIDTSFSSLAMTYDLYDVELDLAQMNAGSLAFDDNEFDVVICIQNGISAFNLDPSSLVRESIRVTRPGGRCLFSSYADQFWNHRLDWFELQSEEKLVGEIDWELTGNGIIVCKDGFKSTTFGPDDFARIALEVGVESTVQLVDRSSVFCEIRVKK